MAFSKATDMKYFSPIGGQSARGNAPQCFSYKTEDAHAAVDAAGYFDEIAGLLSIGDQIYVVVVTNRGASNEALSTAGTHVVKDKAATAPLVDVTDVTVHTVTDTD